MALTDAETRVLLSKADFFELRALLSEIDLIQLKAQQAAHEFKEQLRQALERKDAKWTAVTTALNIDPAATYQLDDATCELIAINGRPPT